MNCQTCQNLFVDFLDRELAGHLENELQCHLKECDDCSRELYYLEKTVTVLKRIEVASPPPELLDNVMRAITRKTIWSRIASWLPQWDLAPAMPVAASVAVIVLLVMVLLRPAGHLDQGTGQYVRTGNKSADVRPRDVAVPPDTVAVSSPAEKSALSVPAEPEQVSLIPAVVGFTDRQFEARRSVIFPALGGSSLPNSGINFVTLGSNVPSPGYSPLKPSVDFERLATSHSGSAGSVRFSPDINATVYTSSVEEHAAIYHRLMDRTSWKTHAYENNLLLVFIHPEQLPAIQDILHSDKTVYVPASAGDANFFLPKKLMVVAVRLQ